jgi:mycofactocin precursor peptide peptidase
MRVDRLTWPQLAGRPPLLVPVGSTEQHGPHLPTGTDTLVARAVSAGVAARPDIVARIGPVVAPAVSYGASGEHEDFPGTLSIGHEALALLLVELGRSASRWTDRVLLVNGHGGNVPTVRSAVVRLRAEGRDVAWVACSQPGADAHAGAFETSLLLALAPETVRRDAAEAGATQPLAHLMARLRAGGVRSVSPNGVLGDPAPASADAGAAALAAMVEEAADRLLRWTPDVAGMLR